MSKLDEIIKDEISKLDCDAGFVINVAKRYAAEKVKEVRVVDYDGEMNKEEILKQIEND